MTLLHSRPPLTATLVLPCLAVATPTCQIDAFRLVHGTMVSLGNIAGEVVDLAGAVSRRVGIAGDIGHDW